LNKTLRRGDVIGQRFKLWKKIGNGTFGEVFLAKRIDDSKKNRRSEDYAVKFEKSTVPKQVLHLEMNCLSALQGSIFSNKNIFS
jgi:NADH:ubiquinone oxidoreductase subunit